MAMSKQDYIEQGRQDFIAGRDRKGSKQPVNSWQENAYDEGYNGALREKAVASADIMGTTTGRISSATEVAAPRVPKAIPSGVMEHMGILTRKARDLPKEDPRRERYLAKVQSLSAKWFTRVHG